MNKLYLNRRATRSLRALLAVPLTFLFAIAFSVANAQSIANYGFTSSVTGNLDDLTTGSTSLLTGNNDDAATSVTAIGFNFWFMGVSYSHFSANSNGQVKLHTSGSASAIAGTSTSSSSGTALLFAMSGDNESNNGIRYRVTGTAPNRKLVIEWREFYVYYTNLSNAGDMQMWLEESTGKITYVYGETYNSSGSSLTRSIGISSGTSATTLGSVTVGATPSFTAASSPTSNTFAAGSGTSTGSPLIANLGSSAQGSRVTYVFTPPVPAAPSSLTFTGVNATAMTLNWADNASNEMNYLVYRSLDGITYSLVSTLAANTTTYSASALNSSTLYYWKVEALAEGGISSDLLNSQSTTAPLLAGGTYTVGTSGTYQNLTTAFADINAQGLTGNVELQLITGYPAAPETYPIASCNAMATGPYSVKVYPTVTGLSITSPNTTGTLSLNGAANVTFDGRVNQTGAKDLVISNTNAGTSYAVQFVNDASSNTLEYLTISSANTGSSSGTVVFAGSNGTTGNDNNIIDNCDIRDGASTPLNGIYSAGASTTVDNSGNTVSNSNIYNYFGASTASNGILLSSNSSAWTINANRFYQTAARTLTGTSQHRGINIITSSGSGYIVTNNVIGFGDATGAGTTSYTAAAGRFFGIEITSSTSGTASSIQGNTISGISLTTTSGASSLPGVFAGISSLGGSVSIGDVTPNIIGASTGTGAINIVSSTNAAIACGIHASSAGSLTVANNIVGSITATGDVASTGINFTAINTTGGSTATTVTGNTIGGATANSITANVSGTTTASATVIGIATAGASSALTVSNNAISNLTNYATGSSVLSGISPAGSPTSAAVSGNNINTLSLAAGTLNGINSSWGVTGSILKNKIYNLSTAGTAALTSGIVVGSGTTVNVYNNLIADLKSPDASAADAIRGISVTSTSSSSVYNVYYNTVYLNGTSTGTDFGTSGIFHTGSTTATTAALDIRNNIIINESTPNGTGITAAFRRGTASATDLISLSNRNMFYAGTPSATRVIYTDGTAQQTLANYLANVLPVGHDLNSFSGETFTYGTPGSFFISLTGSGSDFLRPVAGITTQAESGANNTTAPAITDDYAGVVRAGNAGYAGTGSNPDVGAFEFEGITPAPVITLNAVTPGATTQCTATARLVSVDITTASGTITGATIGYAVNGVPQTNIVMTNTTGNTWEGTIPVPTPTNATITWAIATQNSLGINGTYTGTSYADEPLFGVTASATASNTTVCAGDPTILTAKLVKPNYNATIGTGSSVTGGTEELTAFCNRRASYRIQLLYTAAELSAAGLSAGDINSVAYTITSVGDNADNSGFTVKVGATALTALTDYVASGSFTTVFPSATYTHAVGVNTINFSTPYNWDGTSNIIVELSYTGTDQIYNAQTVYTTTTSNTVAYGYNGASTGTLSTSRFNTVFNGVGTFPISSVSWSDGSTTVGTTNPLTINPTATNTYTATITAAGCTAAPAPTATVTVNPLPSMPTATASAQCGVQIPGATVTSTSGLPTPTFNWYDVAAGGTALQSGTSNTYTSTISTTTTFYISELNPVTGCESPRVAVTVTVSSPDPVSLTASASAICIGESVTLTAANTGAGLQTYTYSTESATGSGAETPIAGSPITVTPTASGSFTYTVTGVDGGCAAVATATVQVNALPVINVTATPGTVCSDDNITLTGTSIIASTGSAPVGTQTTTDLTSGVYRYGANTGDFRHQLVFTAAELNAAGIQAGDITAISFNVTSLGSGSSNNYTIKLGHTSATTISGTFLPDPTSTVYSAATYTPVSGANVHTFSTPFNWNGTSNLLIEICYNVSSLGSSATLSVDTPAETRNAGLLGATNACTTAAVGSTFTLRPIVTFSGQIGTNFASTLDWNWTPGTGLNTAVATTTIANTGASPITQAFTATIMDPVTGCANTATTSPVTINPATAAPVAANSTQCGPGVPTASVTGTGTTGNTFVWYAAATGGTAIAGQTGSTYTTSISATTTFYVAEYNGSCESARTPVTVTVTPPPAVSIAGTSTICDGTSTVLTVTSTNDPNYTYTWSDGLGTGASVTAMPSSNTTYTVTAVDASGGTNDGCNTSATYAITVNPAPASVTASASTSAVCEGGSVNLTSSADANDYQPATLTEGFESGLPSAWTFINAGTGNPWASSTTAHTGSGGMQYHWVSTSAANAWAIAPQMYMLAGQTYSVTFWYEAGLSSFPEKLKVTVGNAATVAAQTNVIWDNNGGTSLSNTSWEQGTATFTPSTSGIYYVGFNCYSDEDEYILYVDDISIQYVTTPSTPTYAWTSSPAGFSSSVQNPTGVAPAAATTYTVTASNSYGCTSSASTTVTVNQPSASTMSATACSTYTLNGTTYNASGTYTQVIPNAAGCDSTITLNLTINQPTTSSVSATACGSYTWAMSGLTYTTSGAYTHTLTNSIGCDSVITLNLTINAVPVATATLSNYVLTASSGASYQWINCSTGAAVSGATSQTYSPAANGVYAVIVTGASGCSDTSACVNVTGLGVKELTADAVNIFPNPTHNSVTVIMTIDAATVDVYDATGKLLQTAHVVSGDKIDLSEYERGIYMLNVKTESGSSLTRVVKE